MGGKSWGLPLRSPRKLPNLHRCDLSHFAIVLQTKLLYFAAHLSKSLQFIILATPSRRSRSRSAAVGSNVLESPLVFFCASALYICSSCSYHFSKRERDSPANRATGSAMRSRAEIRRSVDRRRECSSEQA